MRISLAEHAGHLAGQRPTWGWVLVLNVALTTAALAFTPASHADMPLGNYDFHADWDPTHSWVWSLRTCSVSGPISCQHITATPRPSGGAAPFGGSVQMDGNRYSLVADVPTGLVCIGAGLPTRNTYLWDPVTLAGSVTSDFDVGCGGSPGGSFSYPFTLTRL